MSDEGRHEVKRHPEGRAEEYVARSPEGKGQGSERGERRHPVVNSTNAKDVRQSHGLIYQWQPFRDFVRELPPLFKQHWRELALNQDKIPLDPDWPRYFDLDLIGLLRCLTVRDRGLLVGYVFVLVFPHLHYASTLWAQTDIFWLDPVYRQGWAGYRMLRMMEKGLKEIGVKVINVNAKLHFEASRGTIGRLLERLGYQPSDVVYVKFIG